MGSDGDRIQVVIVNYASLDDVRARVASPALRDCDVIVVDNGSDPAEIQRLCTHFQARAVLLPVNRGFAGGVNAALAAGLVDEKRPILLLNPDVDLPVAGLHALSAALKAGGRDAVAPLLRTPDGRLQVGVAGEQPSLWSICVYFLFLAHLFPGLRGIFLTRRQSRKAVLVSWLCMACMLARGDAFTRYGPLPEDELVYGEDVAWGSRATAAGARLALAPAVSVVHRQGASGGTELWQKSTERLYRRQLGRSRGCVAIVAMRVGLSLRSHFHRLAANLPVDRL